MTNPWEGGYLPEWDKLPVEQYLVVGFPNKLGCPKRSLIVYRIKWGAAATEPPNQRRRQLIRQYLELDEMKRPPRIRYSPLQEPNTSHPHGKEINTILLPWRSRGLAQQSVGNVRFP
jgi:hypothetical protein